MKQWLWGLVWAWGLATGTGMAMEKKKSAVDQHSSGTNHQNSYQTFHAPTHTATHSSQLPPVKALPVEEQTTHKPLLASLEKSEGGGGEGGGEGEKCFASDLTEYPCPPAERLEQIGGEDCCQQYKGPIDQSDKKTWKKEQMMEQVVHINKNCLSWIPNAEQASTECRRAWIIAEARTQIYRLKTSCGLFGQKVLDKVFSDMVAINIRIEDLMQKGGDTIVADVQDAGYYMSVTALILNDMKELLPKNRLYAGICLVLEAENIAYNVIGNWMHKAPDGGETPVQKVNTLIAKVKADVDGAVQASVDHQIAEGDYYKQELSKHMICWLRRVAGEKAECSDQKELTKEKILEVKRTAVKKAREEAEKAEKEAEGNRA